MFIRPIDPTSKPRRRSKARPSSVRPGLEGLERRALLTTYSVGPGQAYTTIGSVPWTKLAPGDTVAINWQPNPYHEKILISQSGTATQPINIVGVPGPNGQEPIIDGQNATTSSQFHYYYSPLQANALVLIQRSADQAYDYKPNYINISGLEFRNAYESYTFQDSTGATQNYAEFSAAIYIEGANNITIQNSTLDSSGIGLFVLSNGDEAHTSRNILVQGNSIYGNGVPNSWLEHNVYSEAVGITYQYNYFGPLRSGSAGNNLKDRSAGAVIRYNYFAPGGHLLDLVDAEDSGIVASDPSYATTSVYGNILDNTGPNAATYLVHFGGDSGNTSIYRKTLNFYDNTVVTRSNQSSQWRTILFQLDTNSQTVNASNNIFYSGSATTGSAASYFELMNTVGVANFGVNWMSPGWLPSLDNGTFSGTISGTSNFYSPSSNDPGFVSLTGGDYHLAAGSSAIGRGVALNSGWAPVDRQYVSTASSQARSSISDLGAYQFGTAMTIIPTVTSQTPAASATNVAISTSVTAVFNESVLASPVTFTLTNQATGGAVAATVSYNSTSKTFTLVPSAPLASSATYLASISGVKDAAGQVMAAPFTWTFTTAAAVIPTVTGQTPASGATGVSTTSSVTAVFNESVLASPVTFTLTNLATGAAVAATVSYNSTSKTFTLVPSAPLAGSTTYRASISGVKDAAGQVMAVPATWTFTTATAIVPTVTGQTPASGATGVSTTSSVTAVFNESVLASPVTFTLTNVATGVAVPATVSYNSANRTFTLVPNAALANSTTFKVTISGVKDAAGQVMAAPATWTFTTAAPVTVASSLWPNTAVPSTITDSDPNAVELGVKFTSDVAGYITGLRFYKGPLNTGTHVGHLWTSTGTLLATATFTSETASGWQQVTFSTPVAISANTTYVASYFAPRGRYSASSSYFTSTFNNSTLHAPANAGVYKYGSSGGFPTSTYNASNYWVDVVFSTTNSSAATKAASTTSSSGTGSGASTATSAAVTATVQPTQVSGSTVSNGSATSSGSTKQPWVYGNPQHPTGSSASGWNRISRGVLTSNSKPLGSSIFAND
ncbi:DUF4082 domain-containing protein [Singulisphaera sp. PoT]|uniref:DUF4082 domain-containing protein n=1 Tax=Singulisphaera sp. PoT TaxID=3411797 RepID=UPI003BF56EE1